MDYGSVLISGCSSGIGLETALHLAGQGYRVYAGLRRPESRESLLEEASRRTVQLSTAPLDVTDPRSASAAVERVVQECGRIDGLVCNAGIQIRGYFEDLSEEEVERVFATNLFGAMGLIRAALPHMRLARRGRIVLISSVGGRIGAVALTAYCASKFALEGFGESLMQEVRPLGIGVSIVEPAVVRTRIWGENRGVAAKAGDPAGVYYEWFRASERLAEWAVRTSTATARDCARTVARALAARHPRLRYVVGRRAGLLLGVRRWVPAALFERIYFGLLLTRITGNHASRR